MFFGNSCGCSSKWTASFSWAPGISRRVRQSWAVFLVRWASKAARSLDPILLAFPPWTSPRFGETTTTFDHQRAKGWCFMAPKKDRQKETVNTIPAPWRVWALSPQVISCKTLPMWNKTPPETNHFLGLEEAKQIRLFLRGIHLGWEEITNDGRRDGWWLRFPALWTSSLTACKPPVPRKGRITTSKGGLSHFIVFFNIQKKKQDMPIRHAGTVLLRRTPIASASTCWRSKVGEIVNRKQILSLKRSSPARFRFAPLFMTTSRHQHYRVQDSTSTPVWTLQKRWAEERTNFRHHQSKSLEASRCVQGKYNCHCCFIGPQNLISNTNNVQPPFNLQRVHVVVVSMLSFPKTNKGK